VTYFQHLSPVPTDGAQAAFVTMPAASGLRMGCGLLSWSTENPAVVQKPKRAMLPVLIILFLASYGLMAMLVTEQGHTIDSQRWLIQSLFSDSNKLAHMQVKAVQKKNAEAQAQATAKDHSQTQTPPASGTRRDDAKSSHGTSKLHHALPKPPANDIMDVRRNVLTI
jgi:hypothetical protein